MTSKYWFAYSVIPEQWVLTDLGRWAYPVNWRGSVLLLAVVIAPIAALLLLVPYIVSWPDWALAVLVLAIAGGGTLAGVLGVRLKTDPKRTIEEYRADKRSRRTTS